MRIVFAIQKIGKKKQSKQKVRLLFKKKNIRESFGYKSKNMKILHCYIV